jgi:hypothetical protein
MPLTLSVADYKKGDMDTNIQSFFKDMKAVEPRFKALQHGLRANSAYWAGEGRHRIHCYILHPHLTLLNFIIPKFRHGSALGLHKSYIPGVYG